MAGHSVPLFYPVGDRGKIQIGEESLEFFEGLEGGAVVSQGYVKNLRRVLDDYNAKEADLEAVLHGSQDFAYIIAATTKHEASQRGISCKTKLQTRLTLQTGLFLLSVYL